MNKYFPLYIFRELLTALLYVYLSFVQLANDQASLLSPLWSIQHPVQLESSVLSQTSRWAWDLRDFIVSGM